MISSEILTVNGLDLHCYFSGEGEKTIMLLHGAGLDSAMLSWREVLPILAAQGYRVIAPDLPGYGSSDSVEAGYSLPFYSEIIAALIEQLGGAPITLGGLSMGGGITLKVALDYPHLVRGIIPVDALGIAPRLPWHGLMYWFIHSPFNRNLYSRTAKWRWLVRWSLSANLFGDKSKITDALVDEVMAAGDKQRGSEPFRSFQERELTKTGLATPIFSRLGEISLPTLLVQGSHDTAVPLSSAVEAQKLIPNARLHVMEGCKHWPQKERPEEFSAAVTAFLAEEFPCGT